MEPVFSIRSIRELSQQQPLSNLAKVAPPYRQKSKDAVEPTTTTPTVAKPRRSFPAALLENIKSQFRPKDGYKAPPISAYRQLYVPRLPDPPFHTAHPPSRYFWQRTTSAKVEDGCPLLKELYEEIPQEIPNVQEVLEFANKNIPLKGTLAKDKDGLIYLDVSDDFIKAVLPLIKEEGIERPPYFSYDGPIGAHSAIMLPHEYAQRQGLGPLNELGEELAFTLTGCYSTQPKDWPDVERVWYLTLSCTDAENIRERSMLSAKIYSHEFHIAIGVKKSEFAPRAPKPKSNGTFRINVSCYAA